MRSIKCVPVGLALVVAAPLAGCGDPGAMLPTVSFQDAALVQAPSQQMMAAYYCPQVVPDPFGLTPTACAAAFGPVPTHEDLSVAFDLAFNVHNPNRFPIPVAEMLTAVTVFPGASSQQLGATCVVFCAADQP